jgi:hypothetical protein
MKRFRLSTLMLLVVIAALTCALVFQNIWMNQELRARIDEAKRREMEAGVMEARLFYSQAQIQLQAQTSSKLEKAKKVDSEKDGGETSEAQSK